MILEVAILNVNCGQESEFETAFGHAQEILSSMVGYISHDLRKSLERPNRYILLVNWNTLEDHEIGFRGSPQYIKWRKLLHHFYDPFPEVEHFKSVLSLRNI